MSIEDLHASALAKSSAAAERDAMIDAEAQRIVNLKVESQLSLFTTEEKTAFLEALEQHGNVSRACRAVGISRRTANVARKRDPLFADAWHEILEAKVDNVAEVLYQQCLDPSSANTIARIFYLKAMRREQYGEQSTAHLSAARVNVVVELVPPRDAPDLIARLDAGEVVDADAWETEPHESCGD
jgi:hypothetical protein